MAIFRDGALLLSSEQRIKIIDHNALKVLEQEDAEGKTLEELWPDTPLIDLFKKCQLNGEYLELEFSSTWTQKPKNLSVSIETYKTNAGEGYLMLVRDLTALRRLESIEKEFITNVSHELRTPLTSIKMAAESLQMGAIASPKLKDKFLSNIQREADRLTRLVNELIVLANVSDAKAQLHLSHFDFYGILDDVVSTMTHHAEVNDITLVKDFPEHLPMIEADRDRILQVLINLVDNAIKCNRPNGTVTLYARHENDHIEVKVVDTGIGIPKIDLPRIFDRFFRVDKARSRVTGGTGLGLSIVKDLIEAHGGMITVDSIIDTGTTFIIQLPLKAKIQTEAD